MELLAGARIALTPRPVQRRVAALEVAMLGHCPGRVRLERLLALPEALEELRSVGFGAAAHALLGGAPLSPQWAGLFDLPIPLHSSAEFHDIFPDAATAPAQYVSLLAGNQAWLAQAVDDYFANGGEKLWLVRIPEEGADGAPAAPQAQFLPAAVPVLHDVESLRGLATVLVIPSLAVVALPDLERLQIPARLPDVPRTRLENPDPRFLPCTTETDAGQEPYPSELAAMPAPLPLEDLLRGILQLIAAHRPDLQCLFTLPLAYDMEIGSPAVDGQALDRLTAIGDIRANASAHLLRHVQFLFPYLRGPRFALRSPVGLIAGKQAGVARAKGPWSSMAALPLASEALPYPRLSIAQTVSLRDRPGVGVLTVRRGFDGRSRLSLDDERLVVPALPPADYAAAEDPRRFDGFRAAEIMRFMGFLRRQLQALGEQLVFNIDVDDPRPRLLLEQFFRRLYSQGALRGRVLEEAFRLSQSQPQEGAIQFDIEIAPAFPIDRLFLTFINTEGEWRVEMSDG